MRRTWDRAYSRLSSSQKSWLFHAIQLLCFVGFLKLLGLTSFNLGLIGASRNFLIIDLPFAMFFYTLLFAALKPGKIRFVLAALPVYLFYILFNVFYVRLGRIFRLSDLNEIDELLEVTPSSSLIGITLLTGITVTIYLLNVHREKFWRPLMSMGAVLLFLAVLQVRPEYYLTTFQNHLPGVTLWSDKKSARDNGYFAMVFFNHAMQHKMQRQLESYYDRENYEVEHERLVTYLDSAGNRRNVHLIVMEAFFDPTRFRELRFSIDPIYEGLRDRFENTQSSLVSPIFGGGTARAEFEILCGVPSYEGILGIEFNLFAGSSAHCLPGTLADSGYRAVATDAYKPSMFNGRVAYKGMGFVEMNFPSIYAKSGNSYLRWPDAEKTLFDGDLFSQNLAFVREHLANRPQQPLFNYVIGIYGHSPHDLMSDQALMISVESKSGQVVDDELLRATNQTFYRSRALLSYLDRLQTIDPNSLVIVIGDHQPPLSGLGDYEKFGFTGAGDRAIYEVIGYVVRDGIPVEIKLLPFYEIEQLVFEYLTGGDFCRNYPCDLPASERKSRYFTIIAHATKQ